MTDGTPPHPARPLRYDLLRAEGDFPEWHGRPDRSYLVCTTYRSGSNLLAEALLDVGGFGCPLEYFDKAMRAGLTARWGTTGPAEYRAALYRFRTDPSGTLGVKLDWPHTASLLTERQPPATGLGTAPVEEERVLGAVWHMLHEMFPNPRFLFLTRQDKVRQAVSWVRAKQTRRFWGVPAAALPTDAAPHYDHDQILRTIAMFTHSEQCMSRLFAWAGVEPVRVVYEKFVADYDGTIRRVAEQLDGRRDIVVRPPRLQRQSGADSEQWVGRFLREHQERATP